MKFIVPEFNTPTQTRVQPQFWFPAKIHLCVLGEEEIFTWLEGVTKSVNLSAERKHPRLMDYCLMPGEASQGVLGRMTSHPGLSGLKLGESQAN